MLIIALFSVSFRSHFDCHLTFFCPDVIVLFLLSIILLICLFIHLNFVNLLLNQSTKDFHYYFRFLTLVLNLQMLLLRIYFLKSQILILNGMESATGLGLFRNHMSNNSHLILRFLICFFLIDYFYKFYLLLLLHLHRYPIWNENFCFSTTAILSLFHLFMFSPIETNVKALIYFLQQIKLLLTRWNLDWKQEKIAISDIYLLFLKNYYHLYFLIILNYLFTYFNYQSLFLFE